MNANDRRSNSEKAGTKDMADFNTFDMSCDIARDITKADANTYSHREG